MAKKIKPIFVKVALFSLSVGFLAGTYTTYNLFSKKYEKTIDTIHERYERELTWRGKNRIRLIDNDQTKLETLLEDETLSKNLKRTYVLEIQEIEKEKNNLEADLRRRTTEIEKAKDKINYELNHNQK